jgi:RsiW-degrading membrane proteinase PrsW (M82 family)
MDGVAQDPLTLVWAVALGVIPVLLLLVGLQLMDSYRLVSSHAVSRSLAAGALAAVLAFAANSWLLQAGVEPHVVRRYLAPLIEETLKMAWVAVLIRTHRVGFLVDAGVHGFAAGTGFAVVENIYYVWAMGSSGFAFWLVRGLGTAVLHGTTTAITAIVSQGLSERRAAAGPLVFLPGLALSIAIHSLYNHLLFNPLLATSTILVITPLMLVAVYERSEGAMRSWLGTGLDSDVERLELILSGEVSGSHIGEYLESLRHRFEGPILADMLCLLQIHLELSIRAKGTLIARAAGIDLPIDQDVRARLDELRYLEGSIGRTGRLAMVPLLHTRTRDLWQVYVLER